MTPPFAAVASRPIMWNMSAGLQVLWYSLAAISVMVFLYGVSRPLATYRRGRRDAMPPLRELPRRLRQATSTLYAHSSIAKRDRYAGWAHRGIFYGWVALACGTVIVGLSHDIAGPIFDAGFYSGSFYLACKAVLNALGTALVAGLVMMMIRRSLLRPAKLDYARPDRASDDPQYDRRRYRTGDWIFVVSLLVIALTGYLLEGVRLAMEHPGYNAFQFGGWVMAQPFEGASTATLAAWRHGIWWFHGLLAITFVASIPYTKAGHMLYSYASLVLRDPLAGKRLAPIPAQRAAEPAGYGALTDFSVVHLLQLDACTKCGRCHEACPAQSTGRPLSPRDVILELREHAHASPTTPALGGILHTLLHQAMLRPRGAPEVQPPEATPRNAEPVAVVSTGESEGASAAVIGPRAIREETIWSCMQCNACVEACPVGIEQAPIINQLRRRLLEEGVVDAGLQSALRSVHKSGNSFGQSRRSRGRWAAELDFEIKDARTEPVDVLWFVGDYASFDPRSRQVTLALARAFTEAGLDFGILYDAESNAGNDVRRAGEEGLFEMLAQHNVETMSACSFERIVTSDPHSLNTLTNEYPDFGGRWTVLHHTEMLLELVDGGRLALGAPLGYRVTYHDPCYLGRYNAVFDAPRRLLGLMGCELIEMPRNRESSFCCGAGGGQIWMSESLGAERPSEARIREALAQGELDYFVVSCPKDVTMYEDAIKTTGNTDRLQLRELTELLQESLLESAVAASSRLLRKD